MVRLLGQGADPNDQGLDCCSLVLGLHHQPPTLFVAMELSIVHDIVYMYSVIFCHCRENCSYTSSSCLGNQVPCSCLMFHFPPVTSGVSAF